LHLVCTKTLIISIFRILIYLKVFLQSNPDYKTQATNQLIEALQNTWNGSDLSCKMKLIEDFTSDYEIAIIFFISNIHNSNLFIQFIFQIHSAVATTSDSSTLTSAANYPAILLILPLLLLLQLLLILRLLPLLLKRLLVFILLLLLYLLFLLLSMLILLLL
jgi:hypothetical protein